MRALRIDGFEDLILRTHAELDLAKADEVDHFFKSERPDYVFLAAAKRVAALSG